MKSWRRFIKKPTLLRDVSRIKVPALFVYCEKDTRPSWTVEQQTNLMLDDGVKSLSRL